MWQLPAYRDLGARDPRKRFRLDYCRLRAPWLHKLPALACSAIAIIATASSAGTPRSTTAPGLVQPRSTPRSCAAGLLRLWPTTVGGLRTSGHSLQLPWQSSLTAGAQSSGFVQLPSQHEPGRGLFSPAGHQQVRLQGVRAFPLVGQGPLGACPATLSELAKEFGFVLFEERHSLYMFRQLLTFLLRERPNMRPFLGGAWQLVSKWQRLEPSTGPLFRWYCFEP